jgi:hypothetical protein
VYVITIQVKEPQQPPRRLSVFYVPVYRKYGADAAETGADIGTPYALLTS